MFSHWLFFYEGDLSWWVYLGVIFHGGSILGWSFMMVVSYEVVSPVCTHVCVCVCVCVRARACMCDNFVYCKPEERHYRNFNLSFIFLLSYPGDLLQIVKIINKTGGKFPPSRVIWGNVYRHRSHTHTYTHAHNETVLFCSLFL